jgi:hypothetical protein
MKNLFFMGGTLFMSILTILFVIMIAWFLYHFIAAYNSKQLSPEIVHYEGWDMGNLLGYLP